MRAMLIPVMLGVIAASTGSATAASITSETFSAGANGWQGSGFLEGTWSFTGGAARIKFPNSGMFPIPSIGTLSNLASATSGAITGNYAAADINMLGFGFYAGADLPSSVNLSWGGNGNVYIRSFSSENFNFQTQSWHTMSASLASAAIGEWQALQGSLTNFQAALSNVNFVAIRVARSGVANQEFVVDDIVLGRQPAAAGIAKTGVDGVIHWTGLISNRAYRIESSANLLEPAWNVLESFNATDTTYPFEYPATNHAEYFRIVAP